MSAEEELALWDGRVDVLTHRVEAARTASLAVVAVTFRNLIIRESDRARKAQGSPEKFGRWIENFYPLHEDFSREMLRPAIRSWLIASGSEIEPDRFLDHVLPNYIGESTRALRGILQNADQDSLPPALERVLRGWEAARAETLADRLLKEVA